MDLGVILKELREFRKDNSDQLQGICEEINKTNTKIAEAEDRIDTVENRIQVTEDIVPELLKLHIHLDTKLTDLEGCRIHGVKAGDKESFLRQATAAGRTGVTSLFWTTSGKSTPRPYAGATPRFLTEVHRSQIVKLQDKGGAAETGLAEAGISTSRKKGKCWKNEENMLKQNLCWRIRKSSFRCRSQQG